MFLKEKSTGHLVEVLSTRDLLDPVRSTFAGRYNVGEEMPEPQTFGKADMCFPSGEALPRCWVDVHYRDAELKRA